MIDEFYVAAKYLHWSLLDPAEATGSEEEVRIVFSSPMSRRVINEKIQK